MQRASSAHRPGTSGLPGPDALARRFPGPRHRPRRRSLLLPAASRAGPGSASRLPCRTRRRARASPRSPGSPCERRRPLGKPAAAITRCKGAPARSASARAVSRAASMSSSACAQGWGSISPIRGGVGTIVSTRQSRPARIPAPKATSAIPLPNRPSVSSVQEKIFTPTTGRWPKDGLKPAMPQNAAGRTTEPAGLGAERQGEEPRSDTGGRARGRPARRVVEIAGIARRSGLKEGELRRHGLADDGGAGAARQRDDGGVDGRPMVLVDGRSVGRRHVAGVDIVLDRHGQAHQRTGCRLSRPECGLDIPKPRRRGRPARGSRPAPRFPGKHRRVDGFRNGGLSRVQGLTALDSPDRGTVILQLNAGVSSGFAVRSAVRETGCARNAILSRRKAFTQRNRPARMRAGLPVFAARLCPHLQRRCWPE